MRALTLSQPWATIVAAGLKPIENRKWILPPKMYGQRVAIHAAKSWDKDGFAWIFGGLMRAELPRHEEVQRALAGPHPRGVVLGVATITACFVHGFDPGPEAARPWFFGPYGFELDNVRALKNPIPAKGALGFWTLPADVEASVLEQLGEGKP